MDKQDSLIREKTTSSKCEEIIKLERTSKQSIVWNILLYPKGVLKKEE